MFLEPADNLDAAAVSEPVLPPPVRIPYRSELIQAVATWIAQWNSPEFSRESIAQAHPQLSVHGSQVLVRIHANGPMRPSELADSLVTGASNVSKLLNHLDSLGATERERDPGDARAVRVKLTAEGARLALEVLETAERAFAYMLADWSAEEVASYTDLTNRLVNSGRAYAAMLKSTATTAE